MKIALTLLSGFMRNTPSSDKKRYSGVIFKPSETQISTRLVLTWKPTNYVYLIIFSLRSRFAISSAFLVKFFTRCTVAKYLFKPFILWCCLVTSWPQYLCMHTFAPFKRLKNTVALQDWPSAASNLDVIRNNNMTKLSTWIINSIRSISGAHYSAIMNFKNKDIQTHCDLTLVKMFLL